MLNQIIMCGRLTSDPVVIENEEGVKVCYITIAVPRAYKNAEGTYDTDFIKCTLWNGIAETTSDYCHKGDIVGIKGRLQTTIIEKEDGEKSYNMEVVAEKLSFLSSKKEEEE